jgi:hypothetical protein
MQRRSTTWIPVALLGVFATVSAHAASLDGLAVDITNQSEPVLCAEKDNVSINFANPAVRSFRIEVAHPVYLNGAPRDNWEADWTACDMSADPVHVVTQPPRKVTIYEEPDFWLIGYTFPSFWRPATATVRVGDRVEKYLHMLQLWQLRTDGSEEVIVLYPQDGYWRVRPLAPRPLRYTGYGSSFLVGPIEVEGRPIVKFKEVRFDPKSRSFTMDFERGGQGVVKVVTVNENQVALDVVFDRVIKKGPFAMLRSMYVTEFNNDASRIAVREKGARGWREDNIMKFDKATATDAWIGRLSPSQHNTSSPDFVFNSFSDGPTPKRPKREPPPSH